jgi:hypothetical protein
MPSNKNNSTTSMIVLAIVILSLLVGVVILLYYAATGGKWLPSSAAAAATCSSTKKCSSANDICVSGTCMPPSTNTHALIMGGGSKNNGEAFKNVLNLQKTNHNVNYTLYTRIEDLKTKWENTKTPLRNALIYIYYSTDNYNLTDQNNLYKIFDLIVKNFKTETLDDRTQPNIYGTQTSVYANRVMLIVDILHPTTNYVNLFSKKSTVVYNSKNPPLPPSYSSPPTTLEKQIIVPNFPFTNNTQTSMTYLLSSIQSGWQGSPLDKDPAEDITPVLLISNNSAYRRNSIWKFSDILFKLPDSYLRKYNLSIKGIVGDLTFLCTKYPNEPGCSRSNWQACFTNNYPDGDAKLLFNTMYDIAYIRNQRTILSNPKPPPPKKGICTIL